MKPLNSCSVLPTWWSQFSSSLSCHCIWKITMVVAAVSWAPAVFQVDFFFHHHNSHKKTAETCIVHPLVLFRKGGTPFEDVLSTKHLISIWLQHRSEWPFFEAHWGSGALGIFPSAFSCSGLHSFIHFQNFSFHFHSDDSESPLVVSRMQLAAVTNPSSDT